jgi:hypothetical protein
MEKVDLTKLCGISGYVICDVCKGKRRIPGGKYRDQYGEVIDCPNCNGVGAERVFLDLDQFAKVVTIVMKKTKSRRQWSPKPKKTAPKKHRT